MDKASDGASFPRDIAAAQSRVVAVCETHYPGEDAAKKLVNLIEEVGELGSVLGVAPETMMRALELTLLKSDDPVGDPDCTRKEVGDVLLSVLNLAGTIRVDAGGALEEVMRILEARDPAESAARSSRKVAMGLHGG